MVEVRVERHILEALESGHEDARVERHRIAALLSESGNPVRIERHQATAMFNDRTNPIRIERFIFEAFISLKTIPDPVNQRPTVNLLREANPYRPTLPREIESVSPVLHDYMTEQTDQVRQQHNITQAGDSTVPWEFLTKVSDERLYTLGSLGRFWHDDFGIIQARFCQFTRMRPSDWVNGPVGRLKTSEQVDWQVTNDYDQSDPSRLVGTLASYTLPTDGQFGWVIVDGANHTALLQTHVKEQIKPGDSIVWSGNDTVSINGTGAVLGKVLKPSNNLTRSQTQLDPGAVYIQPGGQSPDSLQAVIDETVDPVKAAIEHLGGQIGSTVSLQTQIDALNLAVSNLAARVNNSTTAKQIAEINQAIAKLQTAIGNTTLAKVKAEIQLAQQLVDQAQDLTTNQLQTKINQISATLQGLVNEDFGQQIQNLLILVTNLPQTPLVPLVDGSIPPNLVYLPDGQLVLIQESF